MNRSLVLDFPLQPLPSVVQVNRPNYHGNEQNRRSRDNSNHSFGLESSTNAFHANLEVSPGITTVEWLCGGFNGGYLACCSIWGRFGRKPNQVLIGTLLTLGPVPDTKNVVVFYKCVVCLQNIIQASKYFNTCLFLNYYIAHRFISYFRKFGKNKECF